MELGARARQLAKMREEVPKLDQEADQSARYVDGSVGGAWRFTCVQDMEFDGRVGGLMLPPGF